MLKLLKYLKPYWLQVLIVLAAIATQVWSGLQLPTLMADIVNRGIVKNDTALIWQDGFLMFGYALLAAFCSLLADYFSSRVGAAFSRDLRNDLYKKVLSFGITEINQFSTASLITRTTNDIDAVQRTVIMILSMLIRAPMTAILAIVEAIRIAPGMSWIIALAVGVLLALVITILSIVLPKFKLFQILLDKITLITRENLTGLRVIRAFNNQDAESKKFQKASGKLAKTALFIDRVMALQNPLMMFVFNGTTLLCIWIGISHLEEDAAYLGNMMAFMQYAIQVIMSFLFLAILFVMLPRASVSAGRINQVLNQKSAVKFPATTKGQPERIPEVEFKNVSFAYQNAEEKILDNVSFIAKAGETTAFIGSTGSGKSTLINLVPRFFDATAGEIKINGLNIKDYSEDDLMQRIGYVPQRGFLFSGDIESNIKFGAPNLSTEKMQDIATTAQASEFIEKQEKRYKSHIAEGGTNVSGGQKQRLSIARALAKNPDIYVFDDSFSALDMKTDAKLRKALAKKTKNAVTLIVAQRISTILNADQIIVLDQGKLIARGTHNELMKSCKIYAEIAESQGINTKNKESV